MIQKREKLNNSALGTMTTTSSGKGDSTPQLISQLNKLYSQKRTPTANAVPTINQPKKSGSANKHKDKAKFAGFT